MRLGLAYWFSGHKSVFIGEVGSTSAKAKSTDVVSIQIKAGMVSINDQFKSFFDKILENVKIFHTLSKSFHMSMHKNTLSF